MGLRIVTYRNEAIDVAPFHGEDKRSEWLPRDIVGNDGQTLIVYRLASDGAYSIDGYEPEHRGWFGGRRQSIHSALEWVQRAIDVRAGKAKDFLGC